MQSWGFDEDLASSYGRSKARKGREWFQVFSDMFLYLVIEHKIDKYDALDMAADHRGRSWFNAFKPVFAAKIAQGYDLQDAYDIASSQ